MKNVVIYSDESFCTTFEMKVLTITNHRLRWTDITQRSNFELTSKQHKWPEQYIHIVEYLC